MFRGDLAVIPHSLRQQVLQLANEGHSGIIKVRQRLRDCGWWLGINEDVEQHVRHCQACLFSDKSARFVTPPLHSIAYPPKPWHTVALDIKGELHGEASRGRYLIIPYNQHSKWPDFRAVNTVTSNTVISFFDELFLRCGLPTKIIIDNGKQFVSRQITRFFTSLGIEHAQTALNYPQANGAVERFNRFLTDQIRLWRVEKISRWDALYCFIDVPIDSALHYTTITGRTYVRSRNGHASRPTSKVSAAQSRQFTLNSDVRRFQRRNERKYNVRKHASPFNVAKGEHVHVRDNIHSNKYEPMWTQLLIVIERINDSKVCHDDTVSNAADLVPASPQTPELQPSPHQPL